MDELIARLEAALIMYSGGPFIGKFETDYVRGVRDGIRLSLTYAREMR